MQSGGRAYSPYSILLDVKYTIPDCQILGIFKVKADEIIYKFDIQNLDVI